MKELLTKVPLFAGLDEAELAQITAILGDREVGPGELIVKQNTTGNEIYLISEGTAEVFIEGLHEERTLVLLGKGQVIGELALIDQGYRSASVRATQQAGCNLLVLSGADFRVLCEQNYRIGFIVMRNLALDVSFKLRHRNLTEM